MGPVHAHKMLHICWQAPHSNTLQTIRATHITNPKPPLPLPLPAKCADDLPFSRLRVNVCWQVVNRDKLQRAGEDNLFVRLLYAKDKAQPVKTRDEQEKLGKATASCKPN